MELMFSISNFKEQHKLFVWTILPFITAVTFSLPCHILQVYPIYIQVGQMRLLLYFPSRNSCHYTCTRFLNCSELQKNAQTEVDLDMLERSPIMAFTMGRCYIVPRYRPLIASLGSQPLPGWLHLNNCHAIFMWQASFELQ